MKNIDKIFTYPWKIKGNFITKCGLIDMTKTESIHISVVLDFCEILFYAQMQLTH